MKGRTSTFIGTHQTLWLLRRCSTSTMTTMRLQQLHPALPRVLEAVQLHPPRAPRVQGTRAIVVSPVSFLLGRRDRTAGAVGASSVVVAFTPAGGWRKTMEKCFWGKIKEKKKWRCGQYERSRFTHAMLSRELITRRAQLCHLQCRLAHRRAAERICARAAGGAGAARQPVGFD